MADPLEPSSPIHEQPKDAASERAPSPIDSPNQALESKRSEYRQFLTAFGSKFLIEDPSAGPPVDEDTLRRLERGELNEQERMDTLYLIATYRSWHEASDRIMQQEAERWEADRRPADQN